TYKNTPPTRFNIIVRSYAIKRGVYRSKARKYNVLCLRTIYMILSHARLPIPPHWHVIKGIQTLTLRFISITTYYSLFTRQKRVNTSYYFSNIKSIINYEIQSYRRTSFSRLFFAKIRLACDDAD